LVDFVGEVEGNGDGHEVRGGVAVVLV
jgi:hypothetical protein